jgi:hypothetical protein
LEQQQAGDTKTPSARALRDRKMKWYADDAGQAIVEEMAAILAR